LVGDARGAGYRLLLRELLALALPVMAENLLHMLVGVNDTYLANHLPHDAAPAGAAVGTTTYFVWFIGLMVGSVAAGSTAIIARARGARHKSLANSVCGQSVVAAVLLGCGLGLLTYFGAGPIIKATNLQGQASGMAFAYLRMLSMAMPFVMLMLIANACLRGAGDTITPALVMIQVDIVNMVCSFALTRGWFGLPALGFTGIALGTAIAYMLGGITQFMVLVRGRRRVRLYLHRMRPHLLTLKRLFRIGLPAAAEGGLAWLANFGVIRIINSLDATNVMPNAHMNTIRIEGLSFMAGYAFAAAAAAMVGQSLGMGNPVRAKRSAYLAFAVGGGIMTLMGLAFIFLGRYPAVRLSPNDAHIAALTTRCLMITGCIQVGFAAYVIFAGALRGAGDTLVVMVVTLASVLGLRFVGVTIVGSYLHMDLAAIWVVLAAELFLRGVFAFLRFFYGGWAKIQV